MSSIDLSDIEFDGTAENVKIQRISDGYSVIAVSKWMKDKTFAPEICKPIVA